jgi:hypothetical protein
MKCHNVHHVLYLEPIANNPYPGQWPDPPAPGKIDGKDEYFIESILDSHIYRCKLQYVVKWIGYNMPDWEPTKLYSESEVVYLFHNKYTDKP